MRDTEREREREKGRERAREREREKRERRASERERVPHGKQVDMIRDRLSRERSSVSYCFCSTEQFPFLGGLTGNFHVVESRHVRLTQLITIWSNQLLRPPVHTAPIQARQSLRSPSVAVAEHGRTHGWIRPKRWLGAPRPAEVVHRRPCPAAPRPHPRRRQARKGFA